MKSEPYQLQQFSHRLDPEEQRRQELCLQLAENLYDLGAREFSQELRAGSGKFLISVVRY